MSKNNEGITIPEGLNPAEFVKDLADFFGCVAGYLDDSQITEFRYNYCQRLMAQYVATEEFAKMDPKSKVYLLERHHEMLFVLEVMDDFFTQKVVNNHLRLKDLIEGCTLPKYTIEKEVTNGTE